MTWNAYTCVIRWQKREGERRGGKREKRGSGWKREGSDWERKAKGWVKGQRRGEIREKKEEQGRINH